MSGRCYACDKILSDFEMTRKYSTTDEYIMLCNRCFKETGLSSVDRYDLSKEEDIEVEE